MDRWSLKTLFSEEMLYDSGHEETVSAERERAHREVVSFTFTVHFALLLFIHDM